MLTNLLESQLSQGNAFHICLHGIMKTNSVDWCGEISIVSHDQRDGLLVSLFIDQASLCNFLNQFQNLDINVEQIESIERDTPTAEKWNPTAAEVLWRIAPGSELQLTEISSTEVSNEK